MSDRQRLLFIAPLPEPTTGHSLACKVLLDGLTESYDVEVVDFSRRSSKTGIGALARVGEVLQLLIHIADAQRRADLIYFTPSESFAGNLKDLFIYALCRRKLVKMVAHLHGGTNMRKLLRTKSPLLAFFNRLALRNLKDVIVLGPRLADVYAGILPPERIHLVANFAQDEFFRTEAEIRTKFRRASPLRLLFLSNLLEGKGHVELVKAFMALEPSVRARLRLDVAGAAESPADEKAFRSLIQDTPEIRYHGRVLGEAKRGLLDAAHVFVLPTYYPYEGQPISILEAYASGAAVITTDHAGIFDTFEPGVNGYVVEKRSVASLAETLDQLPDRTAELEKVGFANAAQARSKYRASYFVEQIRKVIESNGQYASRASH